MTFTSDGGTELVSTCATCHLTLDDVLDVRRHMEGHAADPARYAFVSPLPLTLDELQAIAPGTRTITQRRIPMGRVKHG